jgi:hypothetical protein
LLHPKSNNTVRIIWQKQSTLLPSSRLDLLDLSALSGHNLEAFALIGSRSRIRLSETVAGRPPPRMFVAHFSKMQASLQRPLRRQ